jgi:hypothetical protein
MIVGRIDRTGRDRSPSVTGGQIHAKQSYSPPELLRCQDPAAANHAVQPKPAFQQPAFGGRRRRELGAANPLGRTEARP